MPGQTVPDPARHLPDPVATRCYDPPDPEPAPRMGPVRAALAAVMQGPAMTRPGRGDAHGHRDVRPRYQEVRRGHRRRRPESLDRGRGVHGPGGPVGLRQDHQPADDRRPRGHHRGHPLDRRPGRQRHRAQGSRHRDGLPELRALPPHERLRQPGLRPQAAQGRQEGDRPARQGGGRDDPADGTPRAQAQGALRRPAPARRAGPGDRPGARRLPHGRAALEPRRQAPRPDARRDRPPPQAAQDDDRLRHPRPGRGDDDGPADRRHEPGEAPAGRRAAGALRPSRATGSWRASSAARP